MATMKEFKSTDSSVAKGLRVIGLVVAVAIVSAVGERMALTHDGGQFVAHVSDVAPAATTAYFPSQFPAPTGEAEPHVQAF